MMTIQQRAELYNLAFAKWPDSHFKISERWVNAIWMLGNNYRSKQGYYGEYPPGYLPRVMSMFPDVPSEKILHLFSGVVEVRGVKFDINPDLKPDIVGDAHRLSEYCTSSFQVIFADPPYSAEDAEHYGAPMINRNKVIQECCKDGVLEGGGCIMWFDQVLPMYSKAKVRHVGAVGIIRSTNHRFRMLSIFQKDSQGRDPQTPGGLK